MISVCVSVCLSVSKDLLGTAVPPPSKRNLSLKKMTKNFIILFFLLKTKIKIGGVIHFPSPNSSAPRDDQGRRPQFFNKITKSHFPPAEIKVMKIGVEGFSPRVMYSHPFNFFQGGGDYKSYIPLLNISAINNYYFQPVTDALLRGVHFTHFCAKHMMEGTPVTEAFK